MVNVIPFRLQCREGLGFLASVNLGLYAGMILALSIHYSRASDLVRPDHLVTTPSVPVSAYRDLFGKTVYSVHLAPGHADVLTLATV